MDGSPVAGGDAEFNVDLSLHLTQAFFQKAFNFKVKLLRQAASCAPAQKNNFFSKAQAKTGPSSITPAVASTIRLHLHQLVMEAVQGLLGSLGREVDGVMRHLSTLTKENKQNGSKGPTWDKAEPDEPCWVRLTFSGTDAVKLLEIKNGMLDIILRSETSPLTETLRVQMKMESGPFHLFRFRLSGTMHGLAHYKLGFQKDLVRRYPNDDIMVVAVRSAEGVDSNFQPTGILVSMLEVYVLPTVAVPLPRLTAEGKPSNSATGRFALQFATVMVCDGCGGCHPERTGYGTACKKAKQVDPDLPLVTCHLCKVDFIPNGALEKHKRTDSHKTVVLARSVHGEPEQTAPPPSSLQPAWARR